MSLSYGSPTKFFSTQKSKNKKLYEAMISINFKAHFFNDTYPTNAHKEDKHNRKLYLKIKILNM